MKPGLLWPLILSLLVVACKDAFEVSTFEQGEFSAGPANPLNFPPAYLGVGGVANKPGRGTFTEVAAYSQGQSIGYYAFPFSPTALPSSSKGAPDPLALTSNGVSTAANPAPYAYVFDPSPPTSPFPAADKCVAPAGYTYNAFLDEVRYDQQGNIFTALPVATLSTSAAATWSYQPIVEELAVTSQGEGCQSIKSATTASTDPSISVSAPDNNYLAWALIDPGAAVYRVGQTVNNSDGITAQHYGWYDHYIVAYIDGGYIPTSNDTTSTGTPVTHMTTQNIYYPREILGPSGASGPGGIGQGYDVLDAPRDGTGYSPVCAVQTYSTTTPLTIAELPQDAATVSSLYGTTLEPGFPAYIFCLQVH